MFPKYDWSTNDRRFRILVWQITEFQHIFDRNVTSETRNKWCQETVVLQSACSAEGRGILFVHKDMTKNVQESPVIASCYW